MHKLLCSRRLAQCVSKAFQIAHDRWCHSQTLLIVYLAERQVPNTTHKIEEYAYCPLENIFVFPFIYLLVFFLFTLYFVCSSDVAKGNVV